MTDQLCNYRTTNAAISKLAEMKRIFDKTNSHLNGLPEDSHQPMRERERCIRGFQNLKCALAFLSNFGSILQDFTFKRDLLSASLYRKQLDERFAAWMRFTEFARNPSAF